MCLWAGISKISAQSLEEAITEMLNHHPRLHSQASRTEADLNTITLEKSRLRPNFSLSARGGEEHFNNFGISGKQLGELGNASVLANQLVFDGGSTRNRIREAEYSYQSSIQALEESKQSLALNLATTYVDIIRYQELINYASENVMGHEDALTKMNQKFRSGAGPKADVDLVQARLAMAEATLENRERQLKQAIILYQELTGQEPVSLSEPQFPDWALPISIDEVDLSRNPAISVAAANLAASNAKRDVSRSAFSPTFSLLAQGDASDSKRLGPREEAAAYVVFSMDLFDGGSRRAEVRKADSLYRKAQFDLNYAKLVAQSDFMSAISNLQAAEERMYQLEAYMNSMESVVSAYRKQFELGQRALINVLDVENELLTAKSSVAEERLNRLQAAYRALAASGELLQTLQIQ